MDFLTKKQLTIELLEPIIYLRQAGGNNITNVLRGDIVLNLNKPVVIRSIIVQFVGIARTLWPEGVGKDKRLYDEETIYNQNIVIPLPHFAPINASSELLGTKLSALKHSFPFEFLLPNSITESINTDRGIVEYKLYATVERVGKLSPALVTRREVLLVRVLDESILIGDSVIENSITGHRAVEGILEYTLSVLTKHAISGQILPVYIYIQALCKGLCIEKISAMISEKHFYKSKNYGTTRVENKILKLIPKENSISADKLNLSLDQHGGFWEQEIQFKMANCNDKLHSQTTYKHIRISHWIKIKLFVSFASGSPTDSKYSHASGREYRSYTLESPIDILSSRLVPEFITLPRYDNLEGAVVPNGFHCPYDHNYRNNHSNIKLNFEVSESPPSYEDL